MIKLLRLLHTHSRLVVRLVLFGALAVLTTACSRREGAPSKPSADAPNVLRFAYVVHCDGRVDKLDTVDRRRVDSFLLSERSGSPPAVPAAPDGGFDGCLAQRVVADQNAAKLSLIAPTSARLSADGLQAFRVLTFSLPSWTLTASQPAGTLPEAPRLELDGNGVARLQSDTNWTPATMMDLSSYPGQSSDTGGLILASSGPVSMVSLLSGKDKTLAVGLVDAKSKTVTRLDALPTTNLGHIHLAPSGSHVLVERTENTSIDAAGTGDLSLYNAAGQQVGSWTDESLRGMRFVALTPQGLALFQGLAGYRFVPLGLSFGSAPVSEPMPALAEPAVVYFAQ